MKNNEILEKLENKGHLNSVSVGISWAQKERGFVTFDSVGGHSEGNRGKQCLTSVRKQVIEQATRSS